MFESIFSPWLKHFDIGNKVSWVRCRGLSLSLWGRKFFEKIVATIRTQLSMDKATKDWKELEYARLRIKMPIGLDTKIVKKDED